MTDQQLDQTIGKLLRSGVILAAAVVLGGGVWLLLQSGETPVRYGQFHGIAASLRSVGGIVKGLAHPDPGRIIQFGLLLLIATPVARVILSVAAFAAERDRLYVVTTLIVLVVLSYSLAVPYL